MILEIVGNAVDQYYARAATELGVVAAPDSWVTVRDDGPGIPPGALERFLTTLSAGGTFDGHFPHVHVANWHGIGLTAVNALSERLEIETTCDGVRWAQAFERGEPVTPVRRLGPTSVDGTLVRFRPDPEIFASIELDVDAIRTRLQELAWLHPHLRISMNERRVNGRGGLLGMARDLVGSSKPETCFGIERWDEDVRVDVAMCWAGRDRPRVHSYVNTLHTREGGKHVDGFWQGLALYARSIGARARTGSAVRELLGPGLAVALHLEMIHPTFGNPSKDLLVHPRAVSAVRTVVAKGLESGLPFSGAARQVIHARLGVETGETD